MPILVFPVNTQVMRAMLESTVAWPAAHVRVGPPAELRQKGIHQHKRLVGLRADSGDCSPMARRDVSNIANWIIWGLFGVLFLLPALALLAVGAVLVALGDDGGIPVLFTGVGTLVIGAVLPPSSMAMVAFMARSGPRGEQIRRLHQVFGGELRMPSVLRPAVTPHVRTSSDGVDVDIKLMLMQSTMLSYALLKSTETQHARTGAQIWGGRLQLLIQLDTPTPIRVGMISRTPMAGLGLSLLGRGSQEMQLPEPELNQRILAHTDRPDWLWPQLQSDTSLLQACVQLIDVNYPFLTQFGFHDSSQDCRSRSAPRSSAR